jgi:hypothetical protein
MPPPDDPNEDAEDRELPSGNTILAAFIVAEPLLLKAVV